LRSRKRRGPRGGLLTAVSSTRLSTFCGQEGAGGIARKGTAPQQRFATVGAVDHGKASGKRCFMSLARLTERNKPLQLNGQQSRPSGMGKNGAKTKRWAQAGMAAASQRGTPRRSPLRQIRRKHSRCRLLDSHYLLLVKFESGP